jgi:hypothetical protein
MKKQRKHYTPEEKVAILRRHLGKECRSPICVRRASRNSFDWQQDLCPDIQVRGPGSQRRVSARDSMRRIGHTRACTPIRMVRLRATSRGGCLGACCEGLRRSHHQQDRRSVDRNRFRCWARLEKEKCLRNG